ncbi:MULTISPECIES: TadE family protein [Asticcacaulis]|uniref:TadE family protein n=1 Tax=Asticcacaulis TaxID=76890 RepID=UPI001AE4A894|nr:MULTISPECIES: TadE/TadG family type IV pilus assembly protein [Asticcacaulis]MBP2159336.1 Flp pilus assembly protein TadG [Asticcacaulis solisilvae]MDR6800381.1 Flp pilus assembly protein TadG [Asticcacaulis sp. BE141]
MRRLLRRLTRNRRGATALEFAIVAPVFIAMVFGVFNLGYALYCGAAVRHAIQESSRLLMFDPNTTASTFKTAVVSKLVNVPVTNLRIAITDETVTQTQHLKRVTWTYNYMVYAPFITSKAFEMGSSVTVPTLAAP